MDKKIKIIIAVILIIVVCLICFFTFRNTDETEETYSNNVSENIANQNIIDENLINENKVENTVIENTINEEPNDKQVPENPTEIVPSSSVYEGNSEVGTTDKKQEAIELVKAKWGEDNSVTFRCDSVTTDGEYIIAVVSHETASVRNYFKVNLESKTVTVDY